MTSLRRVALLAVLVGACASRPEPPASEPAAAPDADRVPRVERRAPAQPESAVLDGDAGLPADDASALVEPEPAESAPPVPETIGRSQKPIDVLTARDAAFLVDYAGSDAKRAADDRCAGEAKDDAEKKAACLAKARENFLPDVLRFRKDSEQATSLVVYKRTGSTLRELWVGAVRLEEAADDVVRVELTGRGKGTRPLWRGKSKVEIRVPTDYGLELEDSELGRLRYDAKVGIVSE